MAAPPIIGNLLEFAATRVLQTENRTFFIGDLPKGSETFLSIDPEAEIQLRKTGGTTAHREQGNNYIHYELEITAVDIELEYSMYVLPAADSPEKNQQALARAIGWYQEL